MAITSQEDMTLKPGAMGEEAEYALNESYIEMYGIYQASGDNAAAEILALTMQNDTLSDSVTALQAAQLVNEETISKLQAAVQALSAKLDAEDVTDLDTDYLSTVNDELF